MHKISTDIHYALAVPNTDNYIPAVRKIIDSKALPLLNLSIRQKEINEEKEALNQYGSSDSGASLGDILGKVLKKKK